MDLKRGRRITEQIDSGIDKLPKSLPNETIQDSEAQGLTQSFRNRVTCSTNNFEF